MKPGNEAREGKRKEQMRRGRKERVYSGLPLLFLHLVAYLLDAEKFTLCDANTALVSTNGTALPSLPSSHEWKHQVSRRDGATAPQAACSCRDFLSCIAAPRFLLPLIRCREKQKELKGDTHVLGKAGRQLGCCNIASSLWVALPSPALMGWKGKALPLWVSQDHRMVWDGGDLKDHLIAPP